MAVQLNEWCGPYNLARDYVKGPNKINVKKPKLNYSKSQILQYKKTFKNSYKNSKLSIKYCICILTLHYRTRGYAQLVALRAEAGGRRKCAVSAVALSRQTRRECIRSGNGT